MATTSFALPSGGGDDKKGKKDSKCCSNKDAKACKKDEAKAEASASAGDAKSEKKSCEKETNY